MKANWQRPEYRQKLIEHRNSHEFVKAQGDRLRKRWADPKSRAKVNKARWTPEAKAKQAAEVSARREKMNASVSPEGRARQRAAMREYWRRKKEQI